MYTEHLAILLFLAANSVGQSGLSSHEPSLARLPRGGAEQVSVNLKMDPRLRNYRRPYIARMPLGKAPSQDLLFASMD